MMAPKCAEGVRGEGLGLHLMSQFPVARRGLCEDGWMQGNVKTYAA